MTEKHDKYVCKSCGKVKEMDTGWAEATNPAPEVNMGSVLPPPPEVEPVDREAKKDHPHQPVERDVEKDPQYHDVGLGFVLGDCDDCGGHSWQRVSLGGLEKKDPEPEKAEETEEALRDKGFSEVIPPSPEVSQGSVMMQVDYERPSEDVKKAPRKEGDTEAPAEAPAEAPEAGVTGSAFIVPLGGGEEGQPQIPPHAHDMPIAKTESKNAQDKDVPDKDRYVCKHCGDVLELELGQTKIPGCVKCGSDGWLKESF